MRIFKAGLLILALVMALALPAASQQVNAVQEYQQARTYAANQDWAQALKYL